MAVRYYVGFDLTTSENDGFQIDDGTTTVDETDLANSTKLLHWGFAGTPANFGTVYGYASLRLQLETALQAAWAGTPTVDFSVANNAYTIAGLNAGLTYTMSSDFARILGFSGTSHSGSTSYTSDIAPYYSIAPQLEQVSMPSGFYEPRSVASLAYSDSGVAYGIARTASVLWSDWQQEFETKAATFKADAVSSAPYTWQHLFEDARTVKPVVVWSDVTMPDADYFLRPEGAHFGRNTRERHTESFDDHWRIHFRAFVAAYN